MYITRPCLALGEEEYSPTFPFFPFACPPRVARYVRYKSPAVPLEQRVPITVCVATSSPCTIKRLVRSLSHHTPHTHTLSLSLTLTHTHSLLPAVARLTTANLPLPYSLYCIFSRTLAQTIRLRYKSVTKMASLIRSPTASSHVYRFLDRT